MNQDQIDSLIRSIVKAVGPLLVAHGMTQLSTALNASDTIEMLGGIVMTILAFWASHKSNAPTSATPPAAAPAAPVGAPAKPMA